MRAADGPAHPAGQDLSLPKRLHAACDGHPEVPAHNRGRQAWVRARLAESCGVSVSSETVSKWFTGIARPRPQKLSALAKVLEIDEAWLILGAGNAGLPRAQQMRRASAAGAVNVLAGFIQMAGGRLAFPEEATAEDEATCPRIDLRAIVRGAHYAFHVVLGEKQPEGAYRFAIGPGHQTCTVVGVIKRTALACDFLRLDADLIDAAGAKRPQGVDLLLTREGDGYSYGAEGRRVTRITSFAERL